MVTAREIAAEQGIFNDAWGLLKERFTVPPTDENVNTLCRKCEGIPAKYSTTGNALAVKIAEAVCEYMTSLLIRANQINICFAIFSDLWSTLKYEWDKEGSEEDFAEFLDRCEAVCVKYSSTPCKDLAVNIAYSVYVYITDHWSC